MMELKKIAADNWAWVESMGWHNKTPLEYLALISSEVGEAINECRGESPTSALGEELADIILRVVDFAHHHGIDIQSEVVRKMAVNLNRGTRGRIK
jgi:NTP pyrophosphatase (non-canonical NTP hydrolase)